MYERLCLCALVPRIETRTRLVLIVHRFEAGKPTNTGQLAAACLPNSEIHLRGGLGDGAPSLAFDASTQPLLLFPHADALPLLSFAGSPRPITLVVPDGTWRQAARVRRRIAALGDVPCVALPPEPPSGARLRAQHHAERVPTIAAIARALGILEGPAVRDALDQIARVLYERTLRLRGRC